MGTVRQTLTRARYCSFVLLVYGISRIACSCGEPEVIPNSSRNSTGTGSYGEDTVIRYECDAGYRVEGHAYYTCVGGQWSYGRLACARIYCSHIERPDHGQITFTREVGTYATFECDAGYDLVGYSSMLCRTDGEWRPTDPPTCVPKSCGDFGSVPNANLWQTSNNGIVNVYGNEIVVTCHDGYHLNGRSRVRCTASGSWESAPSCILSTCPPHQGLNSSCIYDTSVSSDGSFMSFLCEDDSADVSVTQVGPSTVMCYNDEWDYPDAACYCDCKIQIRNVFAGNLVNGFLKHNVVLQWTCGSGTVKNTEQEIRCTDGVLNLEPRCVTAATDSENVQSSSTNTNTMSPVTSPTGTVKPTEGTHSGGDKVIKDGNDVNTPSGPYSHGKSNAQHSNGFKVQFGFLMYTSLIASFVSVFTDILLV